MNRSHCDNFYEYDYLQNPVTLPMPPGYKPRDRSPPSDLESESYPTSAKTPSQFSTKRTDGPDLEVLGSDRDPERRFGRQVSNEWNFYPSVSASHVICFIYVFGTVI